MSIFYPRKKIFVPQHFDVSLDTLYQKIIQIWCSDVRDFTFIAGEAFLTVNILSFKLIL